VLALSFQVGDERFALPCRDVVEVVPLVRLRRVPHAPAFVAGIFDYRGEATPVIDLCQLMRGQPTRELLSSRLVIIAVGDRPLALLAEGVTDAIDVDHKKIGRSGVVVPGAPYLDGVVLAGDGTGAITQLIAPDRLLTDEVRQLLEVGTSP
jgi:chemotaxis-related protein WspB